MITLTSATRRMLRDSPACDHLLQGFAGTLFVRSEEEVEHLRQRSILQLLTDVGLPWQMKASQYQT